MHAFIIETFRLGIWLMILTALFVPLERLFALHPQKILRRQLVTDLGYYFLNSLFIVLLLAIPMAALAAGLHRAMPSQLLAALASLPLWARLTLAFVVGEIGFYWGHRLAHEMPFLWRYHAVHHSTEQMDFLSNARAHPLDLVFTRLCGFAPIYALGLGGTADHVGLMPLLLVSAGTIWGFFIHANIRWRFGIMENLLSTPAFHRWHHNFADPININYASMLPCLDRLFGTYHCPKDKWPERYGIE